MIDFFNIHTTHPPMEIDAEISFYYLFWFILISRLSSYEKILVLCLLFWLNQIWFVET